MPIRLLDEVKESIINAYEEKSGLSRSRISHMMDEETWLNAKKALSLGLVDGILFADEKTAQPEDNPKPDDAPADDKPAEPENKPGDLTAMSYSRTATLDSLMQRISAQATVTGTPIAQLDKRLSLLK